MGWGWILHKLAIFGAVVVTVYVISRIMARGAPDRPAAGTWRIAPSRPLVIAVCLLGLIIGGLALYGVWTTGGGAAPLVVCLGAFALAAATAACLSPDYAIVWDRDGIEGPGSLLFPPFGPLRTRLLWRDLVTAGTDPLGNWFVRDATGGTVRWNYAYAGHGALMQAVGDFCPHLTVGSDR
jgi:hypothetical protein